MSDAPIAIVGAGASGLMAALWASQGGRAVVVLEGTDDGGRKIGISGGGRCNLLPAEAATERFVTDSSPNTLRNILVSWPLTAQRRFFEGDLKIPLSVEAGTGKLFPAGIGAPRVRDTLFRAVGSRGADVRFGVRVEDVKPASGMWRLAMDDGTRLTAARVVLASGGRSFPATGSDGWGYEVARRLGHTVHPTYPALVPLTANPPVHAALAGISLEVTVEAAGPEKRTRAEGGFLFTHRGYSGPAILALSHLAVRSRRSGGPPCAIRVCWTAMDGPAWERELARWRGTVETLVARHLPSRLAETLCREADIHKEVRTSQLRREGRVRLLDNLTRYLLPWSGDGGYEKAEVTGGGVDLGEVDPRTLESRVHPGLFFCGEVLDAFGPIGGYNFQWAWATGRAAGLGAAGYSRRD